MLWTLGLYSAVGQEVTPEYAALSIAVERLTTISTSLKRLSAVVCYCVFVLCTMLLWQGRTAICNWQRLIVNQSINQSTVIVLYISIQDILTEQSLTLIEK